MATSKILLSHLRRSSHLFTLYLLRLSHFPSYPAPQSQPNLPLRVSPVAPSISWSFFTSPDDVEENILPRWLTIVTSTVAFRLALLSAVVIHLQKMKRIGELAPKLRAFSIATTYVRNKLYGQFYTFSEGKKVNWMPLIFLWFLAPFLTQVLKFNLDFLTLPLFGIGLLIPQLI